MTSTSNKGKNKRKRGKRKEQQTMTPCCNAQIYLLMNVHHYNGRDPSQCKQKLESKVKYELLLSQFIIVKSKIDRQ